MVFISDIPTSYINCVLHYICWVKGNEVKIRKDSIHSFLYIECKFQFLFSIPRWVLILWLKWCIFGHTSHYNNIKPKTMASVYIVFPCHACLLSSDSLFLHFPWNREVILTSCLHYLWLYYFKYAARTKGGPCLITQIINESSHGSTTVINVEHMTSQTVCMSFHFQIQNCTLQRVTCILLRATCTLC